MSNVVLLNRGTRTYTLQPITKTETVELADGTKVKKEVVVKTRLLPPGGSIETLNAAEAELYLGYRDIADAAKIVPANANKIAEMQREIDRLTAANAKLEEPKPTAAEARAEAKAEAAAEKKAEAEKKEEEAEAVPSKPKKRK